MRIGRLELTLLEDGHIKVDGGAVFGQVPKLLWEKCIKADRRNRVRLGMNCLLIRAPGYNILVDTGAGTKESPVVRDLYGLGTSRLLRNLRNLDLSPRDINIVVLTHLHFDHAGGCTRLNRKGVPTPTFPKAVYMIQRAAWEDALHPNERGRASFHPDDFLPLEEQGQLRLLDGDQEIIPGVWVKVTNGHCRGHQIVLIHQSGGKAAFLGDLIPTPFHLSLPYIAATDQFPEETLERKRELLHLAEREGWLVLFSHAAEAKAGYLVRQDGKLHLNPVTL